MFHQLPLPTSTHWVWFCYIYHDQVCASEKNFALLDKLQKNVTSVRLRRPCKKCDAGAINITSKLLKARAETPENPKVERCLRSVADDVVGGRHSDAHTTVILICVGLV